MSEHGCGGEIAVTSFAYCRRCGEHVAPPDNGATLAATLCTERVERIEKVLGQVTRAFDRDADVGGSYFVEHADECPASILFPGDVRTDRPCACGLTSALESLRDARTDAEQVRLQLERLKEAK